MELDDLTSRISPQRIQNFRHGEHVLVDSPPQETLQHLTSSEQLPTIPPNIIIAPRNTKNPVLRFIIYLSPQQWWSRHISLVVLHTSDAPTGGDPRDYLSLERTFLAYIRTASGLVSLGVIMTQLFILRKLNTRTGSAFGALISAGGVVVTLIGCLRYFKQQKYLTCGKAISAGWDIVVLWLLIFAIFVSMFVMLLVQD